MNRRHVLLTSAAFLAGGGYLLTRPTNGALSDLPGAAIAQSADIDISTIAEMQMGNPDAPVTVIEYASYTCPHCATFHTGTFKQLKADYIDTGKINFIYREVYFDRFGLWASMIARCDGPDRFFGITDLIYDKQQEWARAGGPPEIADELRKIGRLAGIENETLEACLRDNDKAQTLVAWYQQNAEEHDIQSTPSFVINGETYTNMSYSDMAALIDEAAGS
jgi:protein-disulfide isomerase